MDVELKIERGIPIPPARGGKGIGLSSALKKLKKSESVLLPCALASANARAAQLLGKGNYACRTEDKGVRVWRTK